MFDLNITIAKYFYYFILNDDDDSKICVIKVELYFQAEKRVSKTITSVIRNFTNSLINHENRIKSSKLTNLESLFF